MWLQIPRVDGIKKKSFNTHRPSLFLFPHSVDAVGHPWQGLAFFPRKHVPFPQNTYIAVFGYFLLKGKKNVQDFGPSQFNLAENRDLKGMHA